MLTVLKLEHANLFTHILTQLTSGVIAYRNLAGSIQKELLSDQGHPCQLGFSLKSMIHQSPFIYDLLNKSNPKVKRLEVIL